jgi:cell division protein FtsA
MKKYIAAIDLGTTKVVTLVGEQTSTGKFHVIAHSEAPSQGVTRGEVLNIQDVVNAVKPTIDEIKQQTGFDFFDVYVGIAGQHIRCIENRFDMLRNDYYTEIAKEEIKQLELNMYHTRIEPGEEILHVIPQSYNVDEHWGVINPVGMLGKRLEANFRIFVGRTSSAEHTQRCIQRVGLKLNRLVLEPIASAKAVLHNEEKDMGVVMVDIGGGTTDMVVYYDNIIRYTSVIPFGGNIITEDIRKGCGILPRQAEQLKLQYGSCYGELAIENKIITIPGVCGREPREVSFKTLAKIIEARMSEIIEAVMFEIERSGYADKMHAGIVLTGGGALLEHLPEFMKFKTGMDVRRGKPLFLTDDSGEAVKHCSFSTAVGLLMKGFEYEEAGEVMSEVLREPVLVVEEQPQQKNTGGGITVKEEKEKIKKQARVKSSKSFKWNLPGLFDGFFDEIKNTDNEV